MKNNIVEFKCLEEKYTDVINDISNKLFNKLSENYDAFVKLANAIIPDENSYAVTVHINGLDRKHVLKHCPDFKIWDNNSIIVIKLTYGEEDYIDDGRMTFAIRSENKLLDICEYEDLDSFMTKFLLLMISRSTYYLNTLDALLECDYYKRCIVPYITSFSKLNIFSDECAKSNFLRVQYAEGIDEKIKFFDMGLKELIKKYEE